MKYVFKKKKFLIFAAVFDAVGNFLFGFFPRSKTARSLKTILIVRMDHLGDVLLASAVPKLLKEHYPSARVIFLAASWSAPILEENPFIDEILVCDAPWFSKKRYQKGSRSLSFFKLWRVLRRRKIDAALALRGDLRENLLLFLAGIPMRIGYGITGGGFLLTHAARYRSHVHETEHMLDLLKALSIHASRLEPKIYFSSEEETAFARRLAAWKMEGERFVGFQIGAGTPAKEWPFEEDFVQRFRERFPDRRLVLVGTVRKITVPPDDEKIIDLVLQTSLRELALLMRRLEIFVGPDSGPAHLAAALGVPTLFLYSGTNDFEQWRPLAENAAVLRREVPCAPCGLEVCWVEGHPCMAGIEAEKVLDFIGTKKAGVI